MSEPIAQQLTPSHENAARLHFLDGMRGLAALYVVLHHAYFEAAGELGKHLSPALRSITAWLDHGTLAVDVFIVLSGFCLALPLARSKSRELKGGFTGFIKRRAWRIIPPYYAAIALCLLLIALVPMMGQRSGSRWDDALPAFGVDVIATHLLLIHNLSREWIWKIDNPMWSVATEWQIYFVFALVMVPMWRRFGVVAAVCVAFMAGAIAEAYMPADSEACFHFTGLFAMGMLAATIKPRAGWKSIGATVAGSVIAIILFKPDWLHQPKMVVDFAVGLATFTLILACLNAPAWHVTRLFSCNKAIGLGRFSYSLYLLHFPMLAWCNLSLIRGDILPTGRLAWLMFLGVPLALAASYLFHLVFERPFLPAISMLPKSDPLRTDIPSSRALSAHAS